MQIETTVRYHLTIIRLTIIKKTNNKDRQGFKKSKPLYTVSGNVNWCSHYEKLYVGSSKIKKNNHITQ